MKLTTDCHWMALQARALFEHDSRGRITLRQAPDGSRAPRFFLGRTEHGNLWRLREDLPSDLVRALSRLAGKEQPLQIGRDGVPPQPERNEAIRRLLDDAAPVMEVWRGPAYRFSAEPAALRKLAELASRASRISPEDVGACRAVVESFPTLGPRLAQRWPCYGVQVDGDWASVAYTAAGFGGPALEVGVETAPGQKGQGLAGQCVAAWAGAHMQAGAVPLYSASWENRASISVARKLGLVLYGEDLHWS